MNGERHIHRRRTWIGAADVPAPPLSAGLVAAMALDTAIAAPISLLSSLGSAAHVARASAELDEAVRFYEGAGWLADPAGRHVAPTATPDATVEPGRPELLRFESGWVPQEGEPGAERWRTFSGNGTVTTRLLRHPGEPRPWLVLVHGQGMGRPSDLRLLRARRIHERLGVNVAMPVLPLHGPRAGKLTVPDQQFVSNVYVLNNVLGLTQAVWDLRRLLRWLRDDQQATAVGVLGVSLGSYACSLLATHEADLACVVAVVPTADLAASLRAAEPVTKAKRRLHAGLHDERSTAVHRVVSPLARPCLVPPDRRFVIAGQADQIAPPAGAAELWRHWDRPDVIWRPRGHVTTFRGKAYDEHVADALRRSELTERGGT